MNWMFLVWGVVLVMVTSCAASGGAAEDEPAPVDSPAEMEEEGALATVPPDPTAVPTETAVPAADTPAPMPLPTEPAAEAVSPVTVDLGAITPEPPAESEPVEMPAPGVPNPDIIIGQKVSADLARRLGQDVSEIAVVQIEEVTWSDSALGCPAPGYSYLTVLTSGFKITLAAAGKQYTYHTDLNQHFVLCEKGKPVTE